MLFGTAHSQWWSPIRRYSRRGGRTPLDGQPSKTLLLARLSNESLLRATMDASSCDVTLVVGCVTPMSTAGISRTLMQCSETNTRALRRHTVIGAI